MLKYDTKSYSRQWRSDYGPVIRTISAMKDGRKRGDLKKNLSLMYGNIIEIFSR